MAQTKSQTKTITLSAPAAIRYEAETFIERHPEYEVCDENFKAIGDYMDKHKLPLTHEGFEKAYSALWNSGKVKMRPSFEAMLPHLTHEETQEYLEKNGVAMVDANGQFAGYGMPTKGFRMSAVDSKGRQPNGLPLPVESKQLQHDLKNPPTKAEFQSWGAERTREYLVAIGAWNHALPEHLR